MIGVRIPSASPKKGGICMEIVVRVEELFNRGVWVEWCSLSGVSEWAVNEGQMSILDEVRLTKSQAVYLGFIKED